MLLGVVHGLVTHLLAGLLIDDDYALDASGERADGVVHVALDDIVLDDLLEEVPPLVLAERADDDDVVFEVVALVVGRDGVKVLDELAEEIAHDGDVEHAKEDLDHAA